MGSDRRSWNKFSDQRAQSGLDIYSSCMTVAEYRALKPGRKRRVRVTSHPLVAKPLKSPPFVFILLYRVRFDAPKSWRRERRAVYRSNVAIAAGSPYWVWCLVTTRLSLCNFTRWLSPRSSVLAILGPASLRRRSVGSSEADWELCRSRSKEHLAPAPAPHASMVHRQYRLSPRTPSEPAKPELPARRNAFTLMPDSTRRPN